MTQINIYDMWLNTMSLCNVQQNGQIRPASDFQGWYNDVSVELFHKKVAEYQLGQQVTDELNPFHKTVIVPVASVPGRNYGVAILPADYENLIDIRIIRQKSEYVCGSIEKLPIIDGKGKSVMYTDPDYAAMVQQYAGMGLVEKTVYVLDSQRWGSCLEHPDKGPSYDNPKATQDGTGFKIAPVGVQAIVLDYFSTPTNAVFAYTISAQDIVIYNAAGSTQLQWTNIIKNEFLNELVKKYAAAIGNMELYQQYDNNKKQ
jgi:hypothetical protein